MKILLKDLLEKIENEDYIQDLETEKYSALTKSKVKTISQNLVKQVLAALKHNSLAHVQLDVTGQRPASFILETNVVNLPYANYKKIGNFVSADEPLPVKIYFEVSSEYINASKFWIEELAGVDDLNEEIIADHFANLINQKLVDVRNYVKPEKTVSAKKTKEKPKKKS
ncbi:hypothetical protein [Lactobacillus mulieris]|uniref:Uncharacterized protein n=1 Tax=Lactobacillus mulieris TaxID=2508708 RepID=A0AAW5WWD3_9LACO|nr:hypothetical protein [Lactobacillus mulieris]MCZ3621782.1 hypothetical protein [Lactobacillus mulieris]MCZ3623479.1 hypothetical protein [Lactobacillus mulieris]MCZ3635789.1 hypothetical protein [Lactobacillus mulieris]MCZ3689577.1 hypothetical protein [Lactobacillus mulieris]MCZ3695580.1 hypothetical protein [Lactobacillus mulieris]